jgi:hypothetical protein
VQPPQDRIELTEAAALRGLAHPLRLRLVGLLRVHGSLTATQAAGLVGESSGTCSFHLRQLARYGLVEEVDVPGRAKPWRATARFTSWSGGDDPETRAAARALGQVITDRYAELMRGWLAHSADETPEWREAAWGGDTLAYLTAGELAGVGERLRELLAPYAGRLDEPADRPAGARLVDLIHAAIPLDTDATGGLA